MAIIDSDFFNTHMEQLGLKASFSPKAEQLDELIAEASEWVEGYLRRQVEVADVTEYIRLNRQNQHSIILDQYPVISITSIDWADDIGNTGTVDPTLLRLLPYGVLEWKNLALGHWYKRFLYTITYSAGMDPIPSRIKRATALKVVDLFSPQYQGARDQRSVEFVSKIEELIVDLLEDYRRERMG